MTQEKYLRDDFKSILGHAIEEAGEFLSAAGKTMRWGLDSVNPDLPKKEQEMNRDWLYRESKDLDFTLTRLRHHLLGIKPPKERPYSD